MWCLIKSSNFSASSSSSSSETLDICFALLSPFSYCIFRILFYHFYREDSRQRPLFLHHLVDDRSESVMSYYEFLVHLQRQINNWITNNFLPNVGFPLVHWARSSFIRQILKGKLGFGLVEFDKPKYGWGYSTTEHFLWKQGLTLESLNLQEYVIRASLKQGAHKNAL